MDLAIKDIRRHLGKFELRSLKLTDGSAELPAALTVRDRFRQGSPGEADGGGAHGRAQQSPIGDFQTVSGAAEQLGLRHETVVKRQNADRVRR